MVRAYLVELKLNKITEADPAKGWVPAEFYDIIVDADVVGMIQLRLGDTDYLRMYGGQVGYDIAPRYRRRGYAKAALVALCEIAKQRGVEVLWITCRPDNVASRRTLESAGAILEGVVDVPRNSDLFARGDREMGRYRLRVSG